MQPGPDGVSLDLYASISAELAEGDRPLDTIVIAHGLSVAEWNAASIAWQRVLMEDALAEGPLADQCAAAFVRAQDSMRPVPELTPEEWAELAWADARGTIDEVLRGRGLGRADHARLTRRWTQLVARGGAISERYFERFYALQAASSS